MTAYADIAAIPEDDRLRIIGRFAERGKITGVIVEDDAKADLYIEKLRARYKVRVIDRRPGPVKGTVLVRIGPAES